MNAIETEKDLPTPKQSFRLLINFFIHVQSAIAVVIIAAAILAVVAVATVLRREGPLPPSWLAVEQVAKIMVV
jgi:hypothetical protein